MKLADLFEEAILKSPMYEMANLYPKRTGLEFIIWFGEVGGQHGPRIKVSNTPGKFNINSNFVISVTKEPRVITPKSVKISQDKVNDIFDWVKLNYDTLMQMWKIHESGDGDPTEFIDKLLKI